MACGCPVGYSYNTITGLCEQTLNVAFTPGTNIAAIPVLCAQAENMIKGTAIYPLITTAQFPLTGQNTPSPSFTDGLNATVVPASNIITGSLWVGGTTTDGLLNQRGVGLPTTLNTWYGAARCITVGPEDIVSFALSAKEAFRLYIDGVLAIIYQPLAPAKANANLHIFPISLSVGQHTYKAEALCTTAYDCGTPGSQAYGAFLVETYVNVTPAILSGISTQSTLNSYYATSNASIPVLISGGDFDTSSNLDFAQYGCPTGYNNACTQSAFSCTVKNTAPFVNCCYNLTNCVTGAIVVSGTDLSQYVDHIVKIVEYPGCFVVSPNNSITCPGAVPVTVASFNDVYEDCTSCAIVYYKLTDCNGVANPLFTTADLSGVIGLIIKINGNNNCWIPTVTTKSTSLADVVLSVSYASCEACAYVPPTPIPTPPFYELSPVNLKGRSVQPGYDQGPCSSDFVEKVNCNFANQVYSKLLTQKYGVNSCITDDFDKYFIKKQLLELNLINDPNLCNSVNCNAPCGISASFLVFNPIYCTAPDSPNASVIVIPGPCIAPVVLTSQIGY